MKNILLQGKNGSYTFNPRDPQSRIADGGMGVVYVGEQVETNQKVAIKVIYRELAQDERNIERARREAAINVEHPNLIKMLDFIEKDGIFHIVSEYLEGQNLDEFIKQNPKVSTEYAVRVINDVLNGLEALHTLNPPVIHRDIKPSNIFLCYDGTVKLMDFGIARITGGERKSLTGLGTVVGSPHYSPPEQVRGEIDKINETTDIYALGITFYELLAGNPPFDATNEFDILKKQVDEPLPVNSAIPANIFKVIKKATNKKQDDRYASVNKTKEALAAVLEKPSLPNKIENKKTKKKSIKRTNVIFMVLFIIVTIYTIIIIPGYNSIQDKLEHADSYFQNMEYEKAKDWYQSALKKHNAFPLIPGVNKKYIITRIKDCKNRISQVNSIRDKIERADNHYNNKEYASAKYLYELVLSTYDDFPIKNSMDKQALQNRLEDCNIKAEEQAFLENGFTDPRDGQNYKVVKIGNQIWMAENLNYNIEYSWCYENEKSNCDTYGRLYTWNAAKSACPEGWHLPSDKEWDVLIAYLGGGEIAGGKLKETGFRHWIKSNKQATNRSGFSGLPGGYRYTSGTFYDMSNKGYWWSSTANSIPNAWYRYMLYKNDFVFRNNNTKGYGFSVRCLTN